MDLDDKDLDHLEQRTFAREVRDYEGLHWAFALAIFPTGAMGLVLGPVAAVYLVGLCLLGAGVTAVRGGKSRVTHLGSSDTVDRPNWSVDELERMAPEERRHHARVTGVALIFLALACFAFATWVGSKIGFFNGFGYCAPSDAWPRNV